MLQSFTTKASSRQERSRQWRSQTHADFIEFSDDCQASLRGGDFGHLRLCQISMGGHRAAQRPSSASRPMDPVLKVVFQEEGTSTIRQAGMETVLRAGQWCAVREDLDHEIEAPAHSRQLCLAVPCYSLEAPKQEVAWWRRPRNFLRGPATILHASASASILSGGGLSDLDCDQLGKHLAQMVQMIIRAGDEAVYRDVREQRRLAILEYIDANLDDPTLSVATIARAFQCSSRTVHKLFEGEASTVARTIWDRRLARCREEMVDPAMSARSITEIAHFWGFCDSQHFSRAFKTRYGLSPREYRNIHLAH